MTSCPPFHLSVHDAKSCHAVSTSVSFAAAAYKERSFIMVKPDGEPLELVEH